MEIYIIVSNFKGKHNSNLFLLYTYCRNIYQQGANSYKLKLSKIWNILNVKPS